jgi:NAD(P)H dehydrogenase (quinone)
MNEGEDMSNLYLISGATGSTGSKTVDFLLEAGVKVRAYVHRQDERSAALSTLGAELVTGDLLDFEAVRRAMEEVKGAYFVYPIKPGILQATAYFAQAAKEAAVSAIPETSVFSLPNCALSASTVVCVGGRSRSKRYRSISPRFQRRIPNPSGRI